MGLRLRAFDARHPVVYDLLVTAVVALVGVVGVVDGSLDGTVTATVAEPPVALPVVLHVAFTVPVLWRRRHPFGVVCVLVAVTAVMVWEGLDHPGVLGLLVAGCSAAVRLPLPRLAPPGVALLVAVGATAVRWPPDEVAAQYVPLLLTLLVAVSLGLTVRSRRAHQESRVGLAIAAERARIAREMHDVVAHNLAVMVALADGATYSLPHAPQQASALIEKASTAGREALDDMRRLVGVLRADGADGGAAPPRPQPGWGDLDTLVEQVRAAGLTVRLTRSGRPGPWGPGAGLTVYRIAQEALTNSMKHAGPEAAVDVRLRCTPAAVDVEIVDDGGHRHRHRPGPRPDHDRAREPGHGLAGMAERVAAYDGHLRAGPDPAGGWRVTARLRFDQPGRRPHRQSGPRSAEPLMSTGRPEAASQVEGGGPV